MTDKKIKCEKGCRYFKIKPSVFGDFYCEKLKKNASGHGMKELSKRCGE